MNSHLSTARRMAVLFALVAPAMAAADKPTLVENGNQTAVVVDGDKIIEINGYRLLRFRSNGYNDRWVGARISRMDLCWAYHDVSDYVLTAKSFQSRENGFVLEIEARKPSVSGRVRTRLEGRLVSPELGFQYTLSSQLTASQKQWRATSRRARGRKPDQSVPIEPLDFHIDHISPSDNFSPGALPGATELYDGFVLSDDGQNWRLMPKIPVPNGIRPGTFPTVYWNASRPGLPGHRIGFVDRREGGWISELVDASSPLAIEMCWMFFDLHHILTDGVPPWTDGKDTFEAHYSLAFTPVAPAEARGLLDRAAPVPWRSEPEYQLPVFRRYSTFDRLISANSEYAWLASDYDCAVDQAVGYDDSGSIRIEHDDAKGKSAWYAWTWGPCFDNLAPLEGTYRFSAMVKTRDCTSPVRLAVAEFLHDLWLRPDGTWNTNPGKPEKVIWHYSPQQVSGNSDWTRLTIDLPIDNSKFPPERGELIRRGIVLEYQGKGTVWFDNVRIQRIE